MHLRLARAVTPELTWTKVDVEAAENIVRLLDVRSHGDVATFEYVTMAHSPSAQVEKRWVFDLADGTQLTVEHVGGCTCSGTPPPVPTEHAPA